MALGTSTAEPATGSILNKVCGDDVFIDCFQFEGDDAYVAGGTADFTQYVRDELDNCVPEAVRMGSHGNRKILGVITLSADDGGAPATAAPQYRVVFDKENDKLIVVDGAAEAAAGDLSAVRFNILVISC